MMRGIGTGAQTHKALAIGMVVAGIMVLAAALGVAGCADRNGESVTTTYAGAVTTTVAATGTTAAGALSGSEQGTPPAGDGAVRWDESSGEGSGGDSQVSGSLIALEGTAGQKVISDAQMEIEVENGKFEAVFDQALMLADRYGGYIVSSGAHASGEDGGMKSGTIAIRVPAASFSRALADAGKLGEVKLQQIQTQDVTEEYVDLEARIANSEAHVQALLALLAKAKTVDEVLQVQQVLTGAQQQLEELKGRLRYLDEHTSYSTLALAVYETGAVITASTEWGFTGALKDAVRNLVGAVNAMVRGLGVLVPVLIVLGIVAYVIYRIWLSVTRRRREREAGRYQPYPEGGRGPGAAQASAAQQAAAHAAAAVPTPSGADSGTASAGPKAET